MTQEEALKILKGAVSDSYLAAAWLLVHLNAHSKRHRVTKEGERVASRARQHLIDRWVRRKLKEKEE